MNDHLARSEFTMHLREMRQKAALILGCALIASFLVVVLRVSQQEQSYATTLLQVTLASDAIDDGDVTEFRARRLAELSTTSAVLETAGTTSGLGLSTGELRERLDVELGETAGFLSISARGDSAEMAVDLANGMAAAVTGLASPAAANDQVLDRVVVVEPARLDNVSATGGLGTALRDGLLAFVVSAIVVGEAVVLLRIVRGRFSPTDAAVEVSAVADAPVLDLRPGLNDGAVRFVHEHLAARSIITVFDMDIDADMSAAQTLASAAAELSPRVLLVDGSGKGGRVHSSLGLELEPGLAELVRHGLDLRTVVRPNGHQLRCGVITAGVSNASDPSTAVLLTSLQDHLVASGTKTVVVSVAGQASFDESAASVRALPDCVVIAFDPERHRVREIRDRLDQLRALGASISGIVLTSTSGSPVNA